MNAPRGRHALLIPLQSILNFATKRFVFFGISRNHRLFRQSSRSVIRSIAGPSHRKCIEEKCGWWSRSPRLHAFK